MSVPRRAQRADPDFFTIQASRASVPIRHFVGHLYRPPKEFAVRVIAIVNQKGGCGKTTTAINLAAVFARRGVRTLLVDMDPQSHCAAGLGVPEGRIETGIGEALVADHEQPTSISPGLLWEVARDLHLAPSTTRLAALEAPGGGLYQLPDRDRRLESLLSLFADRFDLCLIDCPPTIGLLTFNALRAAREVLVPVETGFFSLKGAQKQWMTIQRTIDRIGRPIACHMLPTLHNPDSSIARDILIALHRDFAGQIVPTVIREHEMLREAAGFGQPVVEYAPDSEAAKDFERLADWLQEHAAQATALYSGAAEIEVIRRAGVGASPIPGATNIANEPSMVRLRGPESSHEGSSRAAELARRVRELSLRHETSSVSTTSAPWVAPGPRSGSHDFEHIFGATQVGKAVLFAQPASGSRSISIAGDFNGWSPSATPLMYNPDTDTFEAMVEIPPGVYRYRIVVDGEWKPDPYNAPSNSLMPPEGVGEQDSVLVVERG